MRMDRLRRTWSGGNDYPNRYFPSSLDDCPGKRARAPRGAIGAHVLRASRYPLDTFRVRFAQTPAVFDHLFLVERDLSLARGPTAAMADLSADQTALADHPRGYFLTSQSSQVNRHIDASIAAGADCVAAGAGRPAGFEHGYFIVPTVFSGAMPTMAIANEKVFGPVPSLVRYADDRARVAIANGTSYGLSGGSCTDEVNLSFTQIPVKQYRCRGSVQKH